MKFIIFFLIVGLVIYFMQKQKQKLSSSKGPRVSVKTEAKLVDVEPEKRAKAEKLIEGYQEPYTTEQKLIIDEPTTFIYFAKFFDARTRHGETAPAYVPPDDHYRKRYEQAVRNRLALRGYQIPTTEILKTLPLRKGLNIIADKEFTRIQAALEHLNELSDLDERLDRFSPRENYFQLKDVQLDMNFIYGQWEAIGNSIG